MYINFSCKKSAPSADDKNQKEKFKAIINYQGLVNEQEFIALWRKRHPMPELQAMMYCLSCQF